MGTLINSALKAQLTARLATKLEQLGYANDTYSSLLQKQAQEYRLDTGEGSQRAIRVRLNEMKDQIAYLEGEIEELQDRIRGFGGIVNMNLRRSWGSRSL